MTPIQLEIYKALEQLCEKSTFTEFVLAKKIRDNANIQGKQKAGIGLKDLEEVISVLGQEKQIFYALHLNSANDILIKKDIEAKILTPEARARRQSSERSMSIFTNADLSKKATSNSKQHNKLRSERKKMNIYKNLEDSD